MRQKSNERERNASVSIYRNIWSEHVLIVATKLTFQCKETLVVLFRAMRTASPSVVLVRVVDQTQTVA